MKLIKTPSILLFLFLLFSSCLNNISFDDTDLNHEPIIQAPFITFTLNQNDFIDPVNNVDNLNVTFIVGEFDILDSNQVTNNLETILYDVQINNQFNRDITIILDFLDEFDQFTHRLPPFGAPAGDSNYSTVIGIGVADNPDFLRSKRVRVELRMRASNTPLDPTLPREFVFKSSGRYFLNI